MIKPHSFQCPWAQPALIGKEEQYVREALTSTWISGGPYVARFEKKFAQHIKSPHVITTSNGTTALHLAMLGLGIGRGDEVIVPGFTFAAVANMVIACGAKPVFVDVDPHTWCIDAQRIHEAITPSTKAVCVVHLYGNVCEMKAITALCKKRRLFLIEDAAQAALSRYDGKCAGTFGDVGTFSFHATKTIAMGEGGCVVSGHQKLFNIMTIIRNHGMDHSRHYWHTQVGHNFRLPNLQAAIGCAQLAKTGTIVREKKRVYAQYCKYLSNVEGIALQQFAKKVSPVVWAFAFRVNAKSFGMSRNQLMTKLTHRGIETRPGFYSCEEMPIYQKYVRKHLPVAAMLGEEVMSLPSFAQLRDKDIQWIASQILRLKKKS
jgi:perosamine synthetase